MSPYQRALVADRLRKLANEIQDDSITVTDIGIQNHTRELEPDRFGFVGVEGDGEHTFTITWSDAK